MKKSDLFKIGVLLMATTLGTTGCSFGEDEKKPEIVVDPAEKTIEYYIAGKVTEGTTALSGVEVKAGEVTATTDAEERVRINSRLHTLISFFSQNERVMDYLGEFREMVNRDMYISTMDQARTDSCNREHDEIMAAIRNHDGEAAEQAMRKHIRNAFVFKKAHADLRAKKFGL